MSGTLPNYQTEDAKKFVEDMEDAGFAVEHYYGRFHWSGPSVTVDEYADAFSATTVKCQFDNMGAGYVVYPRRSDPAEG
jgi:hypothetical protein